MVLTGNCVPFWLISWGQQGIDSGLAGILMAVMPITTLVLAHFFVRGERLNGAKAMGFGLGFVGVVALAGPNALLELRGTGTALLYELAILGGAVLYAVNAIVARRRPKGDALAAAAGVMIVGSIIMVPAAFSGGAPWPATIGGEAAAALAFLGIASTAAATVVFFKLIAIAGPTFVSLINYLIPVVGCRGRRDLSRRAPGMGRLGRAGADSSGYRAERAKGPQTCRAAAPAKAPTAKRGGGPVARTTPICPKTTLTGRARERSADRRWRSPRPERRAAA